MAAELEFDAGIHFGAAVGDKLDSIRDLLDKKEPKPTYLRLARAGQVPVGATTLILDFGKPPVNKIWNLLALVGYGADDHTTVTGSNIALYAGDPQIASLANLIYTGFTMPGTTTFSKDVEWCYPQENCFANLTGLTAGNGYGANLVVAEWNIRDKW